MRKCFNFYTFIRTKLFSSHNSIPHKVKLQRCQSFFSGSRTCVADRSKIPSRASNAEEYWARVCKSFKKPRNRFPAWRNRFLGSLNLTNTGFELLRIVLLLVGSEGNITIAPFPGSRCRYKAVSLFNTTFASETWDFETYSIVLLL